MNGQSIFNEGDFRHGVEHLYSLCSILGGIYFVGKSVTRVKEGEFRK